MLLSANKAESEAAKWRLDEYVLYIIIFFTQKKAAVQKASDHSYVDMFVPALQYGPVKSSHTTFIYKALYTILL